MLQATERRKVLPAPNLSNCQKREGRGPEHVPECRREQENNSRHPQNTNALHNLPVTTATHPTTSIHSHLPSHHSYTPGYTLGQQKAPPIQSTTSIHSHPPPGCPKSPLLKVQSAFWAILAGVELTEGVLFGQAPPRAQKKEVPTECYFNRDFRKAAAAYSPTWWGSTIGASELNFSVRYGKRWILTAITAAVCYLREISRLKSWLTQKISGY